MSWIVAVGAGAGLGLAYFGGLWLTVCRRGEPARAARSWFPWAARSGSPCWGPG